MARIIIAIHGLGNKPPKRILKKWWRRSLYEGFAAIGHPRRWIRLDMVFWADILHPKPQQSRIRDPKHPLYLEDPYRRSQNKPVLPPPRWRQAFLDYLEKQLDRIFIDNSGAIQYARLADLIVRRYFRDLDRYYANSLGTESMPDAPVRELVRKRLTAALLRHRGKEILLLAHSMGSIVSYDVLTQSNPGIPIHTWITLGSPLGIPTVMQKINLELNGHALKKTKLKTPENIQSAWYNFSDLEDKVAINYNLADDYDANARHISARDVQVYNDYEVNGRRNPHKAYGYLRTPQVARVVLEFIEAEYSPVHRRVLDLLWGMVEWTESWARKTKAYVTKQLPSKRLLTAARRRFRKRARNAGQWLRRWQ